MSSVTVAIISIGDELLTNNCINTTAPWMASELNALGYSPQRLLVVGDDVGCIIKTIKSSPESVLILTGGLGATEDDKTIEAVTQAFGIKKVEDEKHLQFLKKILVSRQLPPSFLKQANVPEGFSVEKSLFGTAPFSYKVYQEKTNKAIFLLPGVPAECQGLFQTRVLPILKKRFSSSISDYQEGMKIINISESLAEQKIKQLNPSSGIKIAYLPSGGELLVLLKGKDRKELRQFAKKLSNHLPDYFSYLSKKSGQTVPSLEKLLHQFFIKEKLRIGFVESCTGGLLTSAFVDLAESSKYLDSSLVTYSNSAKIALGVSSKSLKKYGAVSREVAQEMVMNHANKRKLDIAVSVTGIAGPGGGSKEKPVGLAYLGVYFNKKKGVSKEKEVIVKKVKLNGSRNQIRQRLVKQALIIIVERIFL